MPEVESQEAELLSGVPPTSEPVSLYNQLKAHDELAEQAVKAARRMKEGVDDREFHWKARITGDDDDEDDETGINEIQPPKYTPADLGKFMREGILVR